jgi:hypothetical protein
LYDYLKKTFGRNPVFIDVDKIPAGYDFASYLNVQLARCNVFLSLIGRNWLSTTDDHGISRIDKPDDFVRLEIMKALELKIENIIPVLVDGARLPNATDLPDPLKHLTLFNAAELRNSSFDRDSKALIEQFEGALLRLRRWRWLIATFLGVATSLLLLLLLYLWLTQPQLLKAPAGVAMIDPAKASTEEMSFDMATLPGGDFTVNLAGTYSVKSGLVQGRLEKGLFKTSVDFKPLFPSLSGLAFQACYLHVIGGIDQIDRFPLTAKEGNSVSLSIMLEKGKSYDLPIFKFSFQLPREARVNRTWLCAAFINDGGFIPVQ